MKHICISKPAIIGSDNGLSPGRRQAIIWTNAGILLVGPLGTNFSEILIGIQLFSFKKMHLKMSSAKWRPFCPGLNVLMLNQIYCFRWKVITHSYLNITSLAEQMYLLRLLHQLHLGYIISAYLNQCSLVVGLVNTGTQLWNSHTQHHSTLGIQGTSKVRIWPDKLMTSSDL